MHPIFDVDYKDHHWVHPDSYAGHSPIGSVVVLNLTRDSSLLENNKTPDEWQDENPRGFYDFRQSHWAVGWVETLIITPEAHQIELDAAQEIIDCIEQYPVLDECHYSQLQYDTVYDYWGNASVGERIDYLGGAGDSIFAARNAKSIPEGTFDSLMADFP